MLGDKFVFIMKLGTNLAKKNEIEVFYLSQFVLNVMYFLFHNTSHHQPIWT